MLYFKIKKSISAFLLAGLFVAGFFNALPVRADNYGLDDSAKKVSAFSNQVASADNNFLNTKAGMIIGLILSFVGVLFLLLMIYAGLTWMTAQGNQEQVGKAKDLMINAIIGLIIVLAAYAITDFIGNSFT